MRKVLAAVGLVFALTGTLVRGEKEIEPEALLGHIKFLAADDLKGRGNGSEGLERAADYIAEQFKAAGLQPGVNGGWFQPFELNAGLVVGPDNRLSISSRGRTVTLTLGVSYYPLAATGSHDQRDASRQQGLHGRRTSGAHRRPARRRCQAGPARLSARRYAGTLPKS